ncbi:MAG: MG2 domain protein [Spirochaetes bacterium ADurb.Bin218]|jgi:uncharacterized protein YfaS (alpha-2-macroglobulin family)/5-hydroxyisourate hydrolase-like protein (transthyretin family)|nr:MAG: MG2 domain protein [Spirochaetes bacterium ADurb.Bin218]
MRRIFIGLYVLLAFFVFDAIAQEDRNSGDSEIAISQDLAKISYIEGKVIDDETGKPIAGALIEVKNSQRGIGYYKVTTDRNGYYRIDNFIPYVKYDFNVSAEGYVTFLKTSGISSVQNNIKLLRESLISGIVKDSSGRPLNDVEITLKRIGYYDDSAIMDSSLKPLFTKSNERGEFRFNKLMSGEYSLSFSRSGYITETALLSQIRKGENFKFQMTMFRPATVTGLVKVKGLDAPAVNINTDLSGRYNYSNVTYRDGSFIFEDVKPGVYTLKLTHQGFNGINAGAITVKEGETISGLKFELQAKSPEVNIHSYRYTFTPGNEVEFNLRTLRLESVHIKIYSVPFSIFLSEERDPSKFSPSKYGFKTVAEWDESVKNFSPYEWNYFAIKINKPLSSGGYCIEVSGSGNAISRKFFTVTDIGVIVKKSPEKITVYVTDLVQNKPLKDISIFVFDNKLKKIDNSAYDNESSGIDIERLPVGVIAKGVSDENGLVTFSGISDDRNYVLAVSQQGSYAICNAGSSGSFRSEKEKIFIYTDRPVYRSGDKVFFKIIAKERKERFFPITARKIFYSVQKAYSGKVIFSSYADLDEWGTASCDVEIPSDAELGYFTIKAGFNEEDLYGSCGFYVEHYRKPEFKTEITASKEFYVNGDTAEFKVSSKFLFGAPLSNALVKYRFYEKKIEEEEDISGDYSDSYYSRLKLEGEKYTDSNGEIFLKIFTGNYPYDRDIILETTVIDKANIAITTKRSIRVGRGDFSIKVFPAENFFLTGKEKEIQINTFDHAGKPVSANVEVNLFKYIWKPAQRVYIHDSRPYFTRKLSTDLSGSCNFKLPSDLNASGEFDLIVTARDSRGNVIKTSKVIWIYNDYASDSQSRFKDLEIEINRSDFSGDGELACVVKSRFTDSFILVTLEGKGVYDYRVVKMSKNIMPLSFKIKKDYAPNLYVKALMQRGRALYAAEKSVNIPLEDITFKINISTDKEIYSPGDEVKVNIKTTDNNGKPLSCDLSLAAVDESIFLIRPDTTPEISSYFYSKISNWVITSYSYPITLLAGAAKDSKSKIREDFKDTAFWHSSIRTNSKGEALVSFKIPDNLTTWRLTVRGHDLRGRMAEERKRFMSTKDLVVSLGKPRFFVEGDTVGLIGIVTNNSKEGIEKVQTEFLFNEQKITADKEFNISLTEYGSARKFYSIGVPSNRDKVSLQFSAKSHSSGDSIRLSVPVEKRGLKFSISGSGDGGDSAFELKALRDDEDFDFYPEVLKVTLTPSPVIQMIKACEYLDRFPYGCTEQTINKLIPRLMVAKLLENKNYSDLMPDTLKENSFRGIDEIIKKIEDFQNDDGTWGWWNGDRGNAYLTGYAMFSLFLLKQLGFAINEEITSNGIYAMERFFEDATKADSSEISYLLYVYAIYGKWNHGAFKRIISSEQLTPYQAANLLKAVAILSFRDSYNSLQDFEIKEVIEGKKLLTKQISDFAKRDNKGAYWSATKEEEYSWPGTDLEITAHVLSALIMAGDTSSLVTDAVRYITSSFKGEAWASTKESSTVILALCDYFADKDIDFKRSGKINISVNNKNIGDIDYNISGGKDLQELQKTFPIDRREKSRDYRISVKGDFKGGVISATLAGSLYFKPKGFFSFIKSQERSIKNLSKGITLYREFYRLSRVRDQNMEEFFVPQNIEENEKIRVGEEILVKVKFLCDENYGFLMLEDMLPSGFEVIKESAYDEFIPYSHVERRDNRMVFFFTESTKGRVYEVGYIMRAELPGSFIMRPARLSSMYEEKIQGWSKPVIIDVVNE